MMSDAPTYWSFPLNPPCSALVIILFRNGGIFRAFQ